MAKNIYNEEIIKVPKFSEEAGFYTTKKRSKQMSKIRGKNTKPELKLRRALWSKNIRYRIDNNKLPGKPDIAIKKYKLAVFVDGEFWHGYNWQETKKRIQSNKEFWYAKIQRNMQRDKEVTRELEELGYTVFRFWDHEIKQDLDRCVRDILEYLVIGKNY